MFYTIGYRHGWIHASVDGTGETFKAQTPGHRRNTEHKTMHGAKLALTRDWKLYCTNPKEWKRRNGEIIFNRALLKAPA